MPQKRQRKKKTRRLLTTQKDTGDDEITNMDFDDAKEKKQKEKRTSVMRRLHHIQLLMGALLAGLLLTACSDDDERQGNGREVHLVLGAPATRALPAGFQTYNSLYSSGLPANGQIQGYMTRGTESIMGLFSFTDQDAKRSWLSRMQIDEDGTYYFYGFMPREEVGSMGIQPYNGDYQNGAVLTIDDLDAITTSDLCVIVGAKGYDGPTPLPAITDDVLAMDTRLGKFDVSLMNDENYVYLLADHIYCSLRFEMKVGERYSQLRTIKVKEMKLMSNIGTDTVKTVNVRATVVANNSNANPLSAAAGGSVQITPNQTGTSDIPALLWDTTKEPLELSTTPVYFPTCYAIAVNQNFVLKTVYDVYDRKGNLIRENQTRKNVFRPASMAHGQQYSYKITVAPTYLYTLSEDDLNDPPFTVE